jgi:hypothetical protein
MMIENIHSFSDPDMALLMVSAVLSVTIIAVIYSIKARQTIKGSEKDLFDRMLASIMLFFGGVLFHGIREIAWGNSLLRIPEHSLYLLSFILAISAGIYVIENKDEWGMDR